MLDRLRSARLSNDQIRLHQLVEQNPGRIEILAELGHPPEGYLLAVDCVTLVRPAVGSVTRCRGCMLEILLPDGYPRLGLAPLVAVRHPENLFHPNVAADPERRGAVCLGRFPRDEFLDELVVRLCDVLAYLPYSHGRSYASDEAQSLNPAAAQWTRSAAAAALIPADRRVLRIGRVRP